MRRRAARLGVFTFSLKWRLCGRRQPGVEPEAILASGQCRRYPLAGDSPGLDHPQPARRCRRDQVGSEPPTVGASCRSASRDTRAPIGSHLERGTEAPRLLTVIASQRGRADAAPHAGYAPNAKTCVIPDGFSRMFTPDAADAALDCADPRDRSAEPLDECRTMYLGASPTPRFSPSRRCSRQRSAASRTRAPDTTVRLRRGRHARHRHAARGTAAAGNFRTTVAYAGHTADTPGLRDTGRWLS